MSLIGLKVWPPARHSNRLHLKLATEILSSRWVHCSDWTPDWGVQAEEWKFWSFLHELNCLLSEYSQARGLWSGYEAAQSYSESICWMLLPRLISAGAGDTHSLHWLLCSWKWKRWGSGWECCLLRLSGVRKLTNHHHQDQHTFPTTPPCSSSLQQSAELLHSKRFHICSAAVVCSNCIHSDVYSLIFWNVKDWPHFMIQLKTPNYLPPINFFEGNCISCFPIEIFLLLQETWYNCCLEDLYLCLCQWMLLTSEPTSEQSILLQNLVFW